MTLAAVAVGFGLLASTYAAVAAETQPAYESSVKVGDQGEGEGGEAANLASMAKIDAAQATSAALAQVPGTVLKVSLDNENGGLVYSVEIKTASNEIKDVKVDAGNAKVLGVDAGGEDNGDEGAGNEEGGAEEGNGENGGENN
jgi:uncharacterized membrane protein YkoI